MFVQIFMSNLSTFYRATFEDLSHCFNKDYGKNNSNLAILIHYECCVYSNKCETILTVSQHNNHIQTAGLCLAGTVGTYDLHYTVHAQHWVYRVQFVRKNVRVRRFSLVCGQRGWAHSRPVPLSPWRQRSEVRANTPHETGTTLALHPLTKRTGFFA